MLVVVSRFSFLEYPPNNKKEGMLAGVSGSKQITYDVWIIITRKAFSEKDIDLNFLSTIRWFYIYIFMPGILLCNYYFCFLFFLY